MSDRSRVNPSNSNAKHGTRRAFLKTATATSATAFASPAFLRSASPNETLNVACIGVGGMAGGAGVRDAASAKNTQIVALCDIDANILATEAKKHAEAKTFRDYRRLFDAMEKDVDAVTVATPDHMHAPIALGAMDLGKHVYCQKPLAHNIAEVRAMTRMAEKKGVVTQLGTQIHSYDQYRSAVAALRDGVIGKVSEVHLWIGNSWAGPPEKRPNKTDPVPAHLDWELWLGVAPRRPFVNGLYLPFQWRRWKDFGGGTLGDMGCHVLDPVFSALDITAPVSVRSTGPANFAETFAPNSRIEYDFAGTERTTETLTVTWAERLAPVEAAKPHLSAGASLPKQGSILIGEKGMMIIPHVGYAQVYRDGQLINAKVAGAGMINHEHQWIDACRGEGKASTPFSYSGPLTEAVLLGTIATNFRDQRLQWDSQAMRFTNNDDATSLVRRDYAPGFEIKNL